MSDFDFGNANEGQRQAISTPNGPVLIIAGPGTGKTYTLVQRAIYLIKECNIAPENIMIATFTEKAAKELITRITNELSANKIVANINEMYIGTFHSLCLRILKEHLEYTRLRRNSRLLDAFDQQYIVFQNINSFRAVPELENVLSGNKEKEEEKKEGAWSQADKICNYVNNLSEELVTSEQLINDPDTSVAALGQALKIYRDLLLKNNFLDFASIQVEAYKLLTEHPSILKEIQSKITHIMVDEYQDTNYIQEQIIFLLAGERKNICVVGDDDQGLYRFRGATIRNILEFPSKFDKGECRVIPLVINYRSNSDIVDFYNKWMATTESAVKGRDFHFTWDNFRYDKQIEPHKKTAIKSPAVVRLSGEGDWDTWHDNILNFINRLKNSGKLTDYNQIAFLFRSVSGDRVVELADFLEKNNINVYSPRSKMFFNREEIKLALGCLMLMFTKYVAKFESDSFDFPQNEGIRAYYSDCLVTAKNYLNHPENFNLSDWIHNTSEILVNLTGTTDYAYSGLMYQLFEFKPFRNILDTDMTVGVVNIRPTRNLARLTQIIGKFEYLNNIDVFNSEYIDKNTEQFFNLYLKLLYDEGITEYEDDAEYAPSGCVSFLTIHQAKGMEFPIVFVDSFNAGASSTSNEFMRTIEDKYFRRPAFEPYDQTKYFDLWRLFYTAFSRAQDLLILTCSEAARTLYRYFRKPYEELPDAESINLEEFNFKTVKDVNLKDTYSFTSHITVYETCALQYKFYKELEFMPVKANAMLFGRLIHETIEDIHRAALRHEEDTITPENITFWFNSNYEALSKVEHSYLAEQQLGSALAQVLRYVERQNNEWSPIQQAEVDVSLVKPDYIIEGKIDLIRGKGDTVEIVDFKSEQYPDKIKRQEKIEQYINQLRVYAHLVEERTGKKVSKMHIYYTSEKGDTPTVTALYDRADVEKTIAEFDKTVHKIMARDFQEHSGDPNVCQNCDFRHYCKNK